MGTHVVRLFLLFSLILLVAFSLAIFFSHCACATMYVRVSVFMFALHYDGILQVYVCESVGVEWEPQFL